MLRIRFILMSMFLFLLVGANMNVRASVNSDKQLLKSTDKDESENESQEHKSDKSISQLDFFGAFSLVNMQLQWRDLHSGLNDGIDDEESSENKEEISLEEEVLSLEMNEQIIPTSLTATTATSTIPVSTYRTIDGKVYFTSFQNKQVTSTIAYILNCGTYPKSY
jgi:hypothetical protein